MATNKSGLSSQFHTQRSSGSRDCVQPVAGESKVSPGQLRCCVVQQTSYRKGDSVREFFSAKDAAKRKRVNRIAKLKQCKLDARREQWLSQGSRCRPEEYKHVVQHSTRKEETDVPSEMENVCKNAAEKDSECHLHDVVSSDLLTEGNVTSRQSDVNLPTPYLVGSLMDHSNIKQSLEVREAGKPVGKPTSIPRTSEDVESCNIKRPGDPDSSVRDSEEPEGRMESNSWRRGALGNIYCVETCDVPNCTCRGNESSQLCSESSVVRLDHIAGGSKGLDEEEKVLSSKNHDDMHRPGWSTDQISCPKVSCASGGTAESGEVSDLSLNHEGEDDWELAADALSVPGSSLIKSTIQLPEPSPERKEWMEQKGKAPGFTNLQNGVLKPEYKFKAAGYGVKSRGAGGRAWRPDDLSRPPTLPPLAKQLSFQQESSPFVRSATQQRSNLWGPPPVPAYCPICTEELDLTDSSFFPCSCGFRLCLFCHHRIVSDDGRCPGCRKIYSPDVAMKLSRSTFWLSV
ncbi:unnamed protein product [Calypogeia fissa]